MRSELGRGAPAMVSARDHGTLNWGSVGTSKWDMLGSRHPRAAEVLHRYPHRSAKLG